MNSRDLNFVPREYYKIMKLYKSFSYAIKGLILAFEDQNYKIHVLITTLVVSLGFILKISRIDWLFIWLCIGLVLMAEIINTALEKIATYIASQSSGAYEKMGDPKDLGAGAVLMAAFIAAIIGAIIFSPYIMQIYFK